ncbi:MAG: GNAT family N-acetyltransferase [Gammaproteobacteria bacterium]|jgi:RimJ/RimL family protein N-acetyltransferase
MADSVVIETDRLLLRPLQLEDFDAYAEFARDPDAARFLGGPQARSIAWRSFMTMAGAWHLQRISMFSVVLRDTGEWIGRVGPWYPEAWPGTEVGWGVLPRYWGRGYATEASAATMDWAFAELGWDEIIHTIDPRNTASIHVARKLGAELRGPGRLPAPYDSAPVEIWGQSREQWTGRRRD